MDVFGPTHKGGYIPHPQRFTAGEMDVLFTVPVAPPTTYRVLVTGWRDWPRKYANLVHELLGEVYEHTRRDEVRWGIPARNLIIVDGACPYGGVDQYAFEWATAMPVGCLVSSERHPAEVDSSGRILGPARNSKMVALGADEALAFPGPGSKGTFDCMRKIVDADIEMRTRSWSTRMAARLSGRF